MHELRPSWTSLTKGDILNYCYRRGSIKLSDVFLMAGWVYVQDLWWSALELRDLLLLCCTAGSRTGPRT